MSMDILLAPLRLHGHMGAKCVGSKLISHVRQFCLISFTSNQICRSCIRSGSHSEFSFAGTLRTISCHYCPSRELFDARCIYFPMSQCLALWLSSMFREEVSIRYTRLEDPYSPHAQQGGCILCIPSLLWKRILFLYIIISTTSTPFSFCITPCSRGS